MYNKKMEDKEGITITFDISKEEKRSFGDLGARLGLTPQGVLKYLLRRNQILDFGLKSGKITEWDLDPLSDFPRGCGDCP
jgi:hypothetical protein